MTSSNREQQRRVAALRLDLEIGTLPYKCFDRRGVSFTGGPHQRRLATPLLGGVYFRATR